MSRSQTLSKPSSGSTKPKKGLSSAVRGYLIVYNFVSFFGWTLIFSTLFRHMVRGPSEPTTPVYLASKALGSLRPLRLAMVKSYSDHPEPWQTILQRASLVHSHAGGLIALVQSLAILEIFHALFGWVRSPVVTTVMQVSSRLFLVWGVTERFADAWSNPFYATMILAWSVTEVVRYAFYANALMDSETAGLLWARYTTFYVLYPLGAVSEAMCIFVTLPKVFPWNDLSAWATRDYVFLSLFAIWWPGLYVMYTHMIKQRRKAIGKGFWGDKKVKELVEKKKA